MLGRGAFAAAVAATAAAAAADVIVIRSEGPSARTYPPARRLPDDATLRLRARDIVVVLGSSGTRTFRGPGTFSPRWPAPAARGSRTVGNDRRERIAALRSSGGDSPARGLWDLDVTRNGTFCIAAGREIVLWRPDPATPMRMTILAPVGAPQTVQWAAGHATMAWTSGAPIRSGAYAFRRPGAAALARITVRILHPEPSDMQEAAVALIENGCRRQLDILLAMVPRND